MRASRTRTSSMRWGIGRRGRCTASSRDVELYVFEDFLDAAQCETLLALVRSRTRPSEITHYGEPDPDFRTSSTCDLEDLGHPLPAEISRLMAQTLGIHPARGEPLQGQLYECGQEFKAHVDWFAPGTAEFERGDAPPRDAGARRQQGRDHEVVPGTRGGRVVGGTRHCRGGAAP